MRHTPATLALLIVLSGCRPGDAADDTFVVSPETVAVTDGDSFVVKRGRHESEIRLYGIDAPEHRQPWSAEARDALEKLVAGEMLRIESVGRDRYDRIVARVYISRDGLYVNAQMIGRGHAWVYRRFTTDRDLLELEGKARAERAGLWALPDAQRQPPWEWRQAREQ